MNKSMSTNKKYRIYLKVYDADTMAERIELNGETTVEMIKQLLDTLDKNEN